MLMKRFGYIVAALMLLLLSFGWATTPVQAASASSDGSPSQIYFLSYDYPFDWFVHEPKPAEANTLFYQYLSEAFAQTPNLALAETQVEADYLAELHCGGIFYCSEMQLNIFSPDRQVLASVRMDGRRFPWSWPRLEETANKVVTVLNHRLAAFDQGGYGTYDVRGYRHTP